MKIGNFDFNKLAPAGRAGALKRKRSKLNHHHAALEPINGKEERRRKTYKDHDGVIHEVEIASIKKWTSKDRAESLKRLQVGSLSRNPTPNNPN